MKRKQKLFSSQFINGNDESKQYYKKYSNQLTRTKKRSKSLLCQATYNDVKDDWSCTWRVLKEILAALPKRPLNHFISLLEADGENLTTAEDNANTPNIYGFFSNGKKTCQKHWKTWHTFLYTLLSNNIAFSVF